jgi:hypothetical protein
MRIGKQAEHLVIIKNATSIKDEFTKLLTILKASGLSLWLVYDTLGFLNSTKTIKLKDSKQITKSTNFSRSLFIIVSRRKSVLACCFTFFFCPQYLQV